MSRPLIIDTHAHLYHKHFDKDRSDILARAQGVGVAHIILPNIDLDSIAGMLALEHAYPQVCFATMGLHPCSVQEDFKQVLGQMEQWLERHSFVGIGETGIDLYWDKSTLELQKEALRIQLSWASALHLPIILHTREANQATLQVVQDHARTHAIKGVFHCFSGTVEEAKQMMDVGFFLGIGGTVTFKNSTLSEVIKEIGLGHLVLETDSPYLAPVPHRGKRNESAYTDLVAQHLAEVLEISKEEVCRITTQNARTLFKV